MFYFVFFIIKGGFIDNYLVHEQSTHLNNERLRQLPKHLYPNTPMNVTADDYSQPANLTDVSDAALGVGDGTVTKVDTEDDVPSVAALGDNLDLAPFVDDPSTKPNAPSSSPSAPSAPAAKKRKKSQDEFTIAQKLDILAELDLPNALSPTLLAAKHNTSRTSVYRWKKDVGRLKMMASMEGKGNYKRVTGGIKAVAEAAAGSGVAVDEQVKLAASGADVAANDIATTTFASVGIVARSAGVEEKKRKSGNEEKTAAEKLAILKELRVPNPPSVRTLAERHGANHRSVYRWKKDEERLIKLVEEQGRGDSKRVGGDHLYRIKNAVQLFHDQNQQPGGQNLPMTGTLVAAKAIEARDELLVQHEVAPFLTEEEVKAMAEFKGSTSWGRKFIQKSGWKTSSDEDHHTANIGSAANPYATGLDVTGDAITMGVGMSGRTNQIRQAGGNVSLPRLMNAHGINELKAEINSLKRQLRASEARADILAKENEAFKKQLGVAKNVKTERGDVDVAELPNPVGDGDVAKHYIV